jgi:hypothetical protein
MTNGPHAPHAPVAKTFPGLIGEKILRYFETML